MECKDDRNPNQYVTPLVLIETLWNVKAGMVSTLFDGFAVLIETLWNVKVNTDFSLM